jgi:hypothetical protein
MNRTMFSQNNWATINYMQFDYYIKFSIFSVCQQLFWKYVRTLINIQFITMKLNKQWVWPRYVSFKGKVVEKQYVIMLIVTVKSTCCG